MNTRPTLFASLLAATALISAVQAQVKLVRKQPEGKRTHVTTHHTDQKLTIAGQDVPTVVDIVQTESYDYAKPDADGSRKVAVKDESLKFELKLSGNSVGKFDSDKPGETRADLPQLQPIFEGFKAANGKTRTMIFDKDGKLKSIEGLDGILAGVPAEAKTEIERGYSRENYEREAKKDRDRIPDRELKKGDKWQVTESAYLGQGQVFTFDMYYEYQGSVEKDGRTLDKISLYAGSVKYTQLDDPNAQFKVVNSDLKVDSSMGTLYFDREKGEVIEVTQNIKISGPMTFNINNMELPGKVDLTLDSQTVIK